MTATQTVSTVSVLIGTITQPYQRYCYSEHVKSAVYLVRYTNPVTKLHMAKPVCDKCLAGFVEELGALRIQFEVALIKVNDQNGTHDDKK